jgi:hypothetical protein
MIVGKPEVEIETSPSPAQKQASGKFASGRIGMVAKSPPAPNHQSCGQVSRDCLLTKDADYLYAIA